VQFPNIGRSYDDLLLGMRGVLLKSYIIFYRSVNGGIEIVRVISGYRDLPTIFEDL
jgi:toxin ParE1/3/4